MFAVSTSFAADENVTLSQVDDEITVDNDVLSVEEDTESLNMDDKSSDVVSASNTVTNSTFYDYFDHSGNLLDTVTADELEFEGDFTDVGVNYINIEKSIKFTGKDAVFENVTFAISANGVAIDGFTFKQTSSSLFAIAGNNTILSNNNIIFNADKSGDSYVIYAGPAWAGAIDGLKIINNNFTYTGDTSTGQYINNVIFVSGFAEKFDFGDEPVYENDVSSKNILIDNNNFNILIPSVNKEDGEWGDTYPRSTGIALYYCENVTVNGNKIKLKYNMYKGSIDTINVISCLPIVKGFDMDDDYNMIAYFAESKNIKITDNVIDAEGHKYIYGILMSADDFEISDNKLNISSDTSYACGINIEGPAYGGVVSNNNISVSAPQVLYGIYTWPTLDEVNNVTYEYNNIYGESQSACGVESRESNSTYSNNNITMKGNYTWGIAQSMVEDGIISNNNIVCTSTETGMNYGDSLLQPGSMAVTIKGDVLIEGNTITSNNIGINLVEGGYVIINNNVINVEAINETFDNYAIFADIDSLNITNNNISFRGKSNGTAKSDAIFVNGADGVIISNNEMDVTATAGQGSAINVENSEGLILTENKIDYDCEGPVVSYGTNNVITVGYNCDDAIISGNTIVASGNKYTYGIYVCSSNFTIEKNNLNISSDVYYACGISVDPGLIKGIVKDNTIDVKAQSAGYGIYSFGYDYGGYSAYSKDISYEDNVIVVNAYLANPLQLCEDNSYVYNNKLYAFGNLTCGIFDKVSNDGKAIILNNTIVSDASEIHSSPTGDDYLTNESVSSGIDASGNVLIQGNDITSSAIGIELVISGNSTIKENEIFVAAESGDADNFAISVLEIESLNITDNNVTFVGKSNGDVYSNGLFVYNMENVVVSGNAFDITVPSGGYSPVLMGNPGKGIVFSNVVDLTFKNNDIDLGYGSRMGDYDTIVVVEIGYNCDNAVVTNNNINAVGANYTYGIKVYGKNFNISENNLTIISDVYYANGINPEGGATGIVKNNTIVAIGEGAAYPIYSGMYGNMGDLDVDYIDNQIYGNAYFVAALELGGANENVINNTIIAEGNYTIGIASTSQNNIISGNTIRALGNGVGNQTSGDPTYDNQNTGIVILVANAIISDNFIEAANGDYAVNLGGTNSSVDSNYLASKKSIGKDAIANPGPSSTIANVSPSLKTILFVDDASCVYKDGSVYYLKALDENGDPIYNITIQAIHGFGYLNATTNEKGVAEFVFDLDAGEHDITFTYFGNKVYGPKTATAHISVAKKPTAFTAPDKSLLVTATKSGVNYNIVLKDNSGNVLASKKVTITFNGKTSTVSTNSKGEITYKIVATKAGTYKLSAKFAGDDNYAASTKTATIKVSKEATKLTAAKKTYKAKVKTKKYTVTLKNSKGKAIKGLKVTLKVKGKTYRATTNAKGKATFKIKNLKKKGKYTAKINFAGNNLYNKVAKSVKITVKK